MTKMIVQHKKKLTGQGGPGRGQGLKKGTKLKDVVRAPMTTRLHPDVIEAIREHGLPNSRYIEYLVCKDQGIPLPT